MQIRTPFLYAMLVPTKTFFIGIIFLIFTTGHTQFVINEPISQSVSLHKQASILNTGQDQISFNDMFAAKDSLPFKAMKVAKEDIGFTNENFWVKFDLKNNTKETLGYFLETARPIIDYVDLYIVRTNGTVEILKNGDAIPFEDKDIHHRKAIFNIKLQAKEHISGFLRIKSDGEALSMPLQLSSLDSFISETYKEQIFYGLFYGILLLAFVIYMFFSVALKSRMFFMYGMYIVFVGLLQFAIDGFFHQYITPNGGWFNEKAVLFIALVSLIFFILYVKDFLEISKTSTITTIIFNSTFLALGLIITALLVIPDFLKYCYPLANLMGLIVLMEIIGAFVISKIKGNNPDMFFAFGIFFLICGFIVFILNNLNILPSSFFADNGPKFGTGLEIVFLSISMSNRIRLLRLQNDRNQALALQREKDMNAIKSSFLSNLSHELRTPLNFIMGMATSIHSESKEVETQNKGELILDSSKILLSSIKDIVNFTEIEKGEFSLKEEAFNFKDVIQQIERILKPKAFEKNLKLHFPDLKDVPKILIGDKEKLTKILINLLDNAIKFTESGQIWFSLKHTVTKEDKINLSFKIKDTGVGICKEKLSTIFESFTKDSFQDQRKYGGLGMGLYIAKTCVDLQGGKIRIQNNTKSKSQGITATVELPYKMEIERKKAIEKKVDPEESWTLNLCDILLVEDNKMNQTVLKLLVKKYENIVITVANNGQEAIDILEKSTFDIVLMDLQMPIMDGFTAISKIRNGFAGKLVQHIPIIALTADSTEESKQKVAMLGANDYMNKPIDLKLLFQSIKNIQQNKPLKNAS